MKIIRGLVSLLLVSVFFIGADRAASAADSVATDPKTGCQIIWVSHSSYTLVSASWSGPVVEGKAQGKGILTVTIGVKGRKEETQGQGDAEMLAGKVDGNVSFKWSDGNSYDGGYKAGVKSGKGIQRYTNGLIYDGEWKNGIMDGKGMFKRADGQVYEGDIKNGKPEGKGKIRYVNGTTYEGDILNGISSGNGVLKDSSGKVLYEGQWSGASDNSDEQF